MDQLMYYAFKGWDKIGMGTGSLVLITGLTSVPLTLLISFLMNPLVLFSWHKWQRASFAIVWKLAGGPFDLVYASIKRPLLQKVSGVVLDLGSGLGHNLKYLEPSKITKLYLIEPNAGMHAGLNASALKAGFTTDQFIIVPCGAEEKEKIENLTGLTPGSVDSVTSLLALCGIPEPKSVIAALYDYLKPGGCFYFFEHIAAVNGSKSRSVQKLLNPLWKNLYDGCNITRDTNQWILEGHKWSEKEEHSIDGNEVIMPKAYGWAKKA